MTHKILVTGATGNVGLETMRLLVDRGANVVAAVRSPGKLSDRLGRSVPEVQFDFGDPATFDAALDGITHLFLVRPPQLANPKRDMAPVLEAAKTKGVNRVVFLSLQGVEKNTMVPHHHIENLIREAGLLYTFLRPSFFMQNLTGQHKDEIRRGEIYVPAGNGKTNFIDVRDIAAVAAKVLVEDAHVNAAYELTGSESLTYHEVAHILSETLGRSVVYRKPGVVPFLLRTMRSGVPMKFAIVMTAIYSAARLGKASGTTGEVERLLGRPPITLGDFVRDMRDVWL